MTKLKEIELGMHRVYEEEAKAYDKQRDRSLFEKKWLDLFLSKLEKNADVLDVGCGAAEPIASYLIENDLNLLGIDFSQAMIHIATEKFPTYKWIRKDMRDFKLEMQFDGVIAWNSFFHLNQNDQVKALKLFSEQLKENGVLMFTAGPENGEVTGKVNGQPVYHSSFSASEYDEILRGLGIKILEFKLNDSDCNFHSVFLAQKSESL